MTTSEVKEISADTIARVKVKNAESNGNGPVWQNTLKKKIESVGLGPWLGMRREFG